MVIFHQNADFQGCFKKEIQTRHPYSLQLMLVQPLENHKKEKRKKFAVAVEKKKKFFETHNGRLTHLWVRSKLSKIFFPKFDYYILVEH